MVLKRTVLLFLLFLSSQLVAQKDSIDFHKKSRLNMLAKKNVQYNSLKPSKAAFYSAILPGMGQIYNKKYWKAPIVWGALAIPAYYYVDNNNKYKQFRTAYRLRKSGLQDEFTDDEGNTNISLETLETAQKQLRENRDLSVLSFVIIYILQVVEASVNAHLLQFNIDDDISFKPTLNNDLFNTNSTSVGLTIKYSF